MMRRMGMRMRINKDDDDDDDGGDDDDDDYSKPNTDIGTTSAVATQWNTTQVPSPNPVLQECPRGLDEQSRQETPGFGQTGSPERAAKEAGEPKNVS